MFNMKNKIMVKEVKYKNKKKGMWAWCTVIVGFYSQCVTSENIHTFPSSPRHMEGLPVYWFEPFT